MAVVVTQRYTLTVISTCAAAILNLNHFAGPSLKLSESNKVIIKFLAVFLQWYLFFFLHLVVIDFLHKTQNYIN